MARDKSRADIFSRRAAIIGGGQLAVLLGLSGRLYTLQVTEAERYRFMAEDNRINLRLLEPTRGYLVDRYGAPLAVNIQSYRVEIVPEQVRSLKETLDALGQVIEVTAEHRKRVFRDAKKARRTFFPLTVRQDLSWEEVSRIMVNAPDLPGVDIVEGQTRKYPFGNSTAHIIGYVRAVDEDEIDDDSDPLLQMPSFRIGKSGIERQYELALRGKAGRKEMEVNALGREIQEFEERRVEASPGHDIVLTIDIELQRFIIDRLADQNAAAVAVMAVDTGEVLALVSTPSFDPNLFPNGIGPTDWKKINENPYKPLNNKAITGQYAPGSTFKLAVMMAALETGIKTDFTAHCSGYITYGDRRFHCWKRRGHGTVNMMGSIRESCDIYYYELAMKVGMDKIADMATRLGLGAHTGIDLPGERQGVVPTPDWKRAVLGQPWAGGETLVNAIGQGFVLTTPLQLAVMSARLATGRAVIPHLTRDLFDGEAVANRSVPEFPRLDIDERWLKLARKAMDQVVNHEKGTARGSRLRPSKWTMAGKTGTSQVRRISKEERETGVIKNKDLDWLQRDHAVFISFAPVDTPRYAVAVLVEHGGGGSRAAAPVARDIMLQLEAREARLAAGEWPANKAPAATSGGQS